MVTVMESDKPIRFNPNKEDVALLSALHARLGISGTALMRLCLRDKALSLGIWSPPSLSMDPGAPLDGDS